MLEKFTTYQVQVFASTVAEGDGSDVVTVTTDEDSKLYIMYVCTYSQTIILVSMYMCIEVCNLIIKFTLCNL